MATTLLHLVLVFYANLFYKIIIRLAVMLIALKKGQIVQMRSSTVANS